MNERQQSNSNYEVSPEWSIAFKIRLQRLMPTLSATPTFDYFSDVPGSIPGTLNIPHDAEPPVMVLIDYNEETAIRREIEAPEDCTPFLDTESVSWVDVKGLGSEDVLRRLGHVFSLHPLVLEDIVNVPNAPKSRSMTISFL